MVYNLVETATGRNHSQSSAPILDPKAGFHVVETADNVGIWNESTLEFDPSPIVNIVKKSDFYKKVTLPLFSKVVAASKTDVEVEVLLEYIKGLESINFDDPELVYGIDLLVTKSVWTQAEADMVTA